MTKITQRFADTVKAPEHGNQVYWDDDITGFGFRITAKGSRAFVLRYVINRRERRYTIGKYPSWKVSRARDRAKTLIGLVAEGKDILGSKIELRDAPTVKDLADNYLKRHARPHKRPNSVANDESMLNTYVLPAWKTKKVSSITRRDIENLQRRLSNRPYRANRVLALCSKMFSLAVDWGWIERNPVRGIKKFPEEKRTRWLKPDELKRLIAALDKCPQQRAANVVRLLLLTGARVGEVFQMEWQHLDLETGVWTKPSAHTKQKKTEHVPLSEPAVDLLKGLKKKALKNAVYVFPGDRKGKPLDNIRRSWEWVRNEAKLTGVRIHDLRHTYASYLVSSGLSLEIVGRLLGHTQAATTMRYAHLADDPLREATERMGSVISGMEPKNLSWKRSKG